MKDTNVASFLWSDFQTDPPSKNGQFFFSIRCAMFCAKKNFPSFFIFPFIKNIKKKMIEFYFLNKYFFCYESSAENISKSL